MMRYERQVRTVLSFGKKKGQIFSVLMSIYVRGAGSSSSKYSPCRGRGRRGGRGGSRGSRWRRRPRARPAPGRCGRRGAARRRPFPLFSRRRRRRSKKALVGKWRSGGSWRDTALLWKEGSPTRPPPPHHDGRPAGRGRRGLGVVEIDF